MADSLNCDLSKIYLEGKIVNLREISEDDFVPLHGFASDPYFVRYQNWGPNSIEQTRSYFEEVSKERTLKPRVDFNLAIVSMSESQFLGNVSLSISKSQPGKAEIGYNIITSASGKGVATDAASIILTFAFETLNLTEIEAFCHPENLASVRVLEKAGMIKCGILKAHRNVRGAPRDSLRFTASRNFSKLKVP